MKWTTLLLILSVSTAHASGIAQKWDGVSPTITGQEGPIAKAAEQLRDPHAQVDFINQKINGIVRYKTDGAGQDHWQSLHETLDLKTGDCEDYAIAKYTLLHELGYRDLRIQVGRLSRSGKPHAWVEVKIDDTWLILDSRTNVTPSTAEAKDFYTPIFTLSLENGIMIGTLHVKES
jgi:predicted transglutaminase-like cysteine proteinase